VRDDATPPPPTPLSLSVAAAAHVEDDVRLTWIATTSGRTTTGSSRRWMISVAVVGGGGAWRLGVDGPLSERAELGLRTRDEVRGSTAGGSGVDWRRSPAPAAPLADFRRRSTASISFF